MNKIIILFILFLLVISGNVKASTYEVPKDLWKGLIAEASSEGIEGQYRVACVVRNRLNKGLNHGLCGLKRKDLDKFVKREGRNAEMVAKEIVRKIFQEKGVDRTNGATHFESINYKEPSWVKDMQYLGRYKKHKFYKEK